MAPANRHDGFTLIEILVALVVLATAVAALVTAVSDDVNNAAYLRDRTFAHWVAMNKVAELQVSGQWPGVSTQKGTMLLASHEWTWEITVSATDDADIRRLDVNVYPNPQTKQSVANVIAYLPRPTLVANPTTSTQTSP